MYFWNTSHRCYDEITYIDLVERSYAFGGCLVAAGHSPGTVCMIACHSPYATLVAFYGAVSVGAIPMIFPMPRALGSHEALVERIHHWGMLFDKPAVLIMEADITEKFHSEIPDGMPVIRLADSPLGQWDRLQGPAREHDPGRDDVAFFQTTSSSTGDHKAVAISHGNILSNVHGIRAAVAMGDDERMVTWLPLFHDMGLVGTVLFCFCNHYPLYVMTPTQFIKRPAMWLRGMSEHRCTITTAPNFGYDYCARISDKDMAELDLSGVKHFFIGAEPIRVSTIREFCSRFSRCGVQREMVRPAYGLAESTIITTISRPQSPARFIYLDPATIGMGDEVSIVGQSDFQREALEQPVPENFVAACTAGTTIEGMQVEIMDEDGTRLETGRAGEIVIRGSSVALGYVDGKERLIDEFEQNRVGTGDMGVMVDGELFIIERIKNIIIRGGENYMVNAMEQQLADLLEISHENVAVFESDIYDPTSAIVVLVEKHKGLDEHGIESLISRLPGESFPVDQILFSKGRVIPRTTSGKKRHFFCRQLLHSGELTYQMHIELTPGRIAAARLAQGATSENLSS
jgi:acyl-CoA synthetase (AMP-forming)/AMP-acid ligase II